LEEKGEVSVHFERLGEDDNASAIAHRANDEDLTLKEVALQSSDIDEKRFDEIVDPRKMVGPGWAGGVRR
jgi:fumarate hydratase class II